VNLVRLYSRPEAVREVRATLKTLEATPLNARRIIAK
jgi:hypothetical protein